MALALLATAEAEAEAAAAAAILWMDLGDMRRLLFREDWESGSAELGKLRFEEAEEPLRQSNAASYALAAASGVEYEPNQILVFWFGALISDTQDPQLLILTPLYFFFFPIDLEFGDGDGDSDTVALTFSPANFCSSVIFFTIFNF